MAGENDDFLRPVRQLERNSATPQHETSSDKQPAPTKHVSPSSKTLKTATLSDAMCEKIPTPPASEVGQNIGKNGTEEQLLEKKNRATEEKISIAPTEETNDTNTGAVVMKNSDQVQHAGLKKGVLPQPRPYNRLSEERARSQSHSSMSEGVTDRTSSGAEELKKPTITIDTSEVDKKQNDFGKVSLSVTPRQQPSLDSNVQAENPFNLAFSPSLSPIASASIDTRKSLKVATSQAENADDNAHQKTPAFAVDKIAAIPTVSSSEMESQEHSSIDNESLSPARDINKYTEEPKSQSRGKTNFMQVKLSPMVDRQAALNKSYISSSSRGISSDRSAGAGEWKQTQLKNIDTLKVTRNSITSQISFDAILAAQ